MIIQVTVPLTTMYTLSKEQQKYITRKTLMESLGLNSAYEHYVDKGKLIRADCGLEEIVRDATEEDVAFIKLLRIL